MTVSRLGRVALAFAGVALPSVVNAAVVESVVDRSFASTLPGTTRELGRELWALRDGGAVVSDTRRPGTSGIYTNYDHVGPDGAAEGIWTTSFFVTTSAGVVHVLDDGSLIMTEPPYRRDAHGNVVSPFTPPANLTFSGPAALQPDGRLLVAEGALLVRLLADGSVDRTFVADPLPFTSIASLRLDGAGRIVLSGQTGTGSSSILRLLPTGVRDSGFREITPAFAYVVTTNGGVIGVGGYPRYGPDGSPDLESDPRPWTRGASAVAVGPNGETYVASPGFGIFRVTPGPNSAVDPNFFAHWPQGKTVELMAALPDGKLLVYGEFSSWEGFTTSNLVRLEPKRRTPTLAPAVWIDGSRLVIRASARVVVQAQAIGPGPMTFTWNSLDGGPLPTPGPVGPTLLGFQAQLVFDSFQRQNIGRYRLDVSGPGGTTSTTFDLRPVVAPRLANVSSRGFVGSGDDMMIAGVALDASAGSPAYHLVLRGGGPLLAKYQVENPLPDPLLTFRRAGGDLVARNDNWTSTFVTSTEVMRAGAIAFDQGSRDSLLVLDAPGGNYTLTLEDAGGDTGTGLIELYDVDVTDPLADPSHRIGSVANLSLRGRVAANGEPAIVGFVILDSAGFGPGMRILARVVGPSLSAFGVASPMRDPRLTVFDANGRTVATNDDWAAAGNPAETADATARAGAFPLANDSKDAALVLNLPAGAYTVHATSADAAGGVALVEIYRVP